MIQRIQTIWLILATAAGFLTYKFSVFSGNKLAGDNTRIFVELNASTNLVILILNSLVVAASIIAIFFYKNRKVQFRLTLACILASLINVILYISQTKHFIPGEGKYALSSVIALAIPVFLIFAALGIRKDEKLIKNADRLR